VKTIDRSAALRELRELVATYLEGSDDAPRAAELLDALEVPIADEPTTVQEDRQREMFGCTAAALDKVLDRKEPRDIAMYAMGALSNAQGLIQHDGDEPFAWSVRRADANTIRQLMNIAKYAIDKAVPREALIAHPEAARNLRPRVQAMAKKFRDEVTRAEASDDKSPYDEDNIEDAFVLLEQLTKAVPR
jgi:hypothetical protein